MVNRFENGKNVPGKYLRVKLNIVNDVPYFVNYGIKKLNKIKNNPPLHIQFFITPQKFTFAKKLISYCY